jgi:hypothetical protein
MTQTVLRVTIDGRIGEPEIYAAAAAALAAGCARYEISQPHPHDATRTWIAAAGPAAAPLSRPVGRGDSDDSEWTL